MLSSGASGVVSDSDSEPEVSLVPDALADDSSADSSSGSDSDDERLCFLTCLVLRRVKGRCPRRKFTVVLVNG